MQALATVGPSPAKIVVFLGQPVRADAIHAYELASLAGCALLAFVSRHNTLISVQEPQPANIKAIKKAKKVDAAGSKKKD